MASEQFTAQFSLFTEEIFNVISLHIISCHQFMFVKHNKANDIHILIAYCKSAVTQLPKHWTGHTLAPGHQYEYGQGDVLLKYCLLCVNLFLLFQILNSHWWGREFLIQNSANGLCKKATEKVIL